MKKILKKMFAFVVAVAMLLSVHPNIQASAAVKLSATKKTIYVGESFTLNVSGTNKAIKWSSSNKSVASVTQKGKVSAKKSGKSIITAKVSGKSLKCTVFVKDKFSANAALKNISVDLRDTGEGVVAILKNENNTVVNIDAKMVYYLNGKMIDTASDSNYAFESGSECALFFHAPYDNDFNNVEYDNYKITLSVEKGTNLICGQKKIDVKSNFGSDNVSAEITNNSGKDFEYIKIAIVFYNSYGEAIGHEYNYADCLTDGSVDYLSFDFPYDNDYETIIPSSYKIYVNEAYAYNW